MSRSEYHTQSANTRMLQDPYDTVHLQSLKCKVRCIPQYVSSQNRLLVNHDSKSVWSHTLEKTGNICNQRCTVQNICYTAKWKYIMRSKVYMCKSVFKFAKAIRSLMAAMSAMILKCSYKNARLRIQFPCHVQYAISINHEYLQTEGKP